MVTRVEKIRRPTLDVFPADKPNGVGVLILPGGGRSVVSMELKITAKHESGSRLTLLRPSESVARTVRLLLQCGYVFVEVSR